MAQEENGADGAAAMWAAAGLGGGIARTQSVCGAITGAVVALGMAAGASGEERQAALRRIREQSEALVIGFAARFGRTDCRSLTGFDFSQRGGYQAFVDSGTKDARCTKYVAHTLRAILGPPAE